MARPRRPIYPRPHSRRLAVGRTVEAVLCIAVIVSFGYLFASYAQESNEFVVRNVEIHGLSHLDEQSVYHQSGIAPNGNVFTFNETAVARRVEELPFVERCDVRRIYPDTVALYIQERVPAASLHVGRHVFEIDRGGVVLREYGPGEMPAEPFITRDSPNEIFNPGERLDDPALYAALAVWDAFRASSLNGRLTVSELVAMRGDDVRMYCDEVPYEIRWGRGDYAELVRRFEGLWASFDGKVPCFEYVDLRFGQDIACK
jgi:hypothetical protein